jgi:hypothetical protein
MENNVLHFLLVLLKHGFCCCKMWHICKRKAVNQAAKGRFSPSKRLLFAPFAVGESGLF